MIELDQQGNVGHAWGGAEYHPKWPIRLQTVIADTNGFVWVSGEANQDDTRGNIYVGEVDNGKRIQKFAPVLTGAR